MKYSDEGRIKQGIITRNSICYRDAFKEAYKKGVKIGIRKSALGMLKQKLPLDVIQEVTEIPLETIKKLAEENDIPI